MVLGQERECSDADDDNEEEIEGIPGVDACGFARKRRKFGFTCDDGPSFHVEGLTSSEDHNQGDIDSKINKCIANLAKLLDTKLNGNAKCKDHVLKKKVAELTRQVMSQTEQLRIMEASSRSLNDLNDSLNESNKKLVEEKNEVVEEKNLLVNEKKLLGEENAKLELEIQVLKEDKVLLRDSCEKWEKMYNVSISECLAKDAKIKALEKELESFYACLNDNSGGDAPGDGGVVNDEVANDGRGNEEGANDEGDPVNLGDDPVKVSGSEPEVNVTTEGLASDFFTPQSENATQSPYVEFTDPTEMQDVTFVDPPSPLSPKGRSTSCVAKKRGRRAPKPNRLPHHNYSYGKPTRMANKKDDKQASPSQAGPSVDYRSKVLRSTPCSPLAWHNFYPGVVKINKLAKSTLLIIHQKYVQACVWRVPDSNFSISLVICHDIISNGPLLDEVIGGWMYIITHLKNRRKAVPTVLVVDNNFWMYVNSNNIVFMENSLKDLNGQHLVFFPLNTPLTDNVGDVPFHWTLLVLDTEDGKWMHFNSKIQSDLDVHFMHATRIMDYVDDYMKKSLVASGIQNFDAPTRENFLQMPQQAPGSQDCGVCMLMVLEKLNSGITPEQALVKLDFSEDFVGEFRAKMVEKFLELGSKDKCYNPSKYFSKV